MWIREDELHMRPADFGDILCSGLKGFLLDCWMVVKGGTKPRSVWVRVREKEGRVRSGYAAFWGGGVWSWTKHIL